MTELCRWNGLQSLNYPDDNNRNRYFISPDDIKEIRGQLGFCEGIFLAIETALDVLDAIDFIFNAIGVGRQIKETLDRFRLLLNEYKSDPEAVRKALKDFGQELKELARDAESEKGNPIFDAALDLVIEKLLELAGLVDDLTTKACEGLNFLFIDPRIDNGEYQALCGIEGGKDGIERLLVNTIRSVSPFVRPFEPSDPTYDDIIGARKDILGIIFDEVCECQELIPTPSSTSTTTAPPSSTCIPCPTEGVLVLNLGCTPDDGGVVFPLEFLFLSKAGEEINIPVVDFNPSLCTEFTATFQLFTCTSTTCTTTTQTVTPSPTLSPTCTNGASRNLCCNHPQLNQGGSTTSITAYFNLEQQTLPGETYDDALSRLLIELNTELAQVPFISPDRFFDFFEVNFPDIQGTFPPYSYYPLLDCSRPLTGNILISDTPSDTFCCGGRAKTDITQRVVIGIAQIRYIPTILSEVPNGSAPQEIDDQALYYGSSLITDIVERISLCNPATTGCNPPPSTVLTTPTTPTTTSRTFTTTPSTTTPSSTFTPSTTTGSPSTTLDCGLFNVFYDGSNVCLESFTSLSADFTVSSDLDFISGTLNPNSIECVSVIGSPPFFVEIYNSSASCTFDVF